MSTKFLVLFWLLITVLLITGLAQAQQAGKIPRIGFLRSQTQSPGMTDAFRQGLRELGYVEGKNILIEYRSAEGKVEQLPDLATELVRLKVDVIVVGGTPAIRAAKQATGTIPIVFPIAADAVADGLVATLARPGGNMTGFTVITPDLSGKRLELLKESFPKISRVAVLYNPTDGATALDWKETQAAARALGVTLQSLEVRHPDEFKMAFAAMTSERAEALIAFTHTFMTIHRSRLLDFATKSRLPAMYGQDAFVNAGGLMSYGPSYTDLYRRAATYVDKILKGRKPADLPVEQPMKFDLVINLKTAKQIGLTIPQSVLYRADKVIR